MKTRIAALAVSFLVALGLSGCYTEFATTGGNYGDYGSSYNSSSSSSDSSQYGYSPTYYDSTGVPAVNPDYQSNDYGYGTYGMGGYGYGSAWPPYGYGYYGSPFMNPPLWSYSMFSPSLAWWPMDSWYLGFGMSSVYGGPFSYAGLAGWGNYPSYYYPYLGGYYPNNPYYNVYSPYSPYSLNPWYTPYTYASPTPRVRSNGDTRYGRSGYSEGGVVPQQGVGQANTGTANASSGTSGNLRENPTARTRVGSSTGTPTATGASNTNSVPDTRGRAPSYMPTQQNSTPNPQHRVRERAPSYTPAPQRNPSQTPNSPQSNPQPRVREQAPSNAPQQPNQNPAPQSNPQPRVREQAPSYTAPPQQQNPAPNYNPPPQYNPPPSSPPPQAPPPRIRHGYVSYNNGGVRPQSTYRPVRVMRVMRQNVNYSRPAPQQMARYEAPRFQQNAPSYEYRAMSRPAMSAPVAAAPARSGGSSSGGGRTRH